MAVRDPGARTTSLAQDLARPFFCLAGFFASRSKDKAKEGQLAAYSPYNICGFYDKITCSVG